MILTHLTNKIRKFKRVLIKIKQKKVTKITKTNFFLSLWCSGFYLQRKKNIRLDEKKITKVIYLYIATIP